MHGRDCTGSGVCSGVCGRGGVPFELASDGRVREGGQIGVHCERGCSADGLGEERGDGSVRDGVPVATLRDGRGQVRDCGGRARDSGRRFGGVMHGPVDRVRSGGRRSLRRSRQPVRYRHGFDHRGVAPNELQELQPEVGCASTRSLHLLGDGGVLRPPGRESGHHLREGRGERSSRRGDAAAAGWRGRRGGHHGGGMSGRRGQIRRHHRARRKVDGADGVDGGLPSPFSAKSAEPGVLVRVDGRVEDRSARCFHSVVRRVAMVVGHVRNLVTGTATRPPRDPNE